jgi:hypothetical protein
MICLTTRGIRYGSRPSSLSDIAVHDRRRGSDTIDGRPRPTRSRHAAGSTLITRRHLGSDRVPSTTGDLSQEDVVAGARKRRYLQLWHVAA